MDAEIPVEQTLRDTLDWWRGEVARRALTAMSAFSETGATDRPHRAAGLLACCSRWLTWWQAALLAIAAMVFNVFVLPRLSARAVPRRRSRLACHSGIVLYPVAVLGLILCFPHGSRSSRRPGRFSRRATASRRSSARTCRSPPLPWNRAEIGGGPRRVHRSSAAPPAWSGLRGWLPISRACRRGGSSPRRWSPRSSRRSSRRCPIRLNDNSVGARHGRARAVVAALHRIQRRSPARCPDRRRPRCCRRSCSTSIVAVAGWLARTVTIAGADRRRGDRHADRSSAPALARLVDAHSRRFSCAAIATRLGHRRKARAGIAESRGGRRGPGNAIANTGLAAWARLSRARHRAIRPGAGLRMVAALVTSASDTVASEVGKAWGRTTWLVHDVGARRAGHLRRRLARGHGGGRRCGRGSLDGPPSRSDLIPARGHPRRSRAATVASLVEGVLGATLEAAGHRSTTTR